MEKVYIVMEDSYNSLASENGASYIYGVFTDKEKAIDKAIEMIKVSTEIEDWIIDEETDVESYTKNPREFLKHDVIRLFWGHQENWSYYCEIYVKECEVQ